MLDFEPIKNSFSGEIVSRTHSNYDEARSVYNANIDKKPEVILFCKNEADVISAVNFARDASATIAVRCQGHNGSGYSTCDDGVIFDSPILLNADLESIKHVHAAECVEIQAIWDLPELMMQSNSWPMAPQLDRSTNSRRPPYFAIGPR